MKHQHGQLSETADAILKAELHNLLIYAPGQFFLPHRDSEKTDAMIGTLVVSLPSQFKGGAIVIEHHDAALRIAGSHQKLTFAWPLAKDGRRHVHGTIDSHDLPVRHTTRRTGRPYTLMLEKTGAVFKRDAAERELRERELEWLEKSAAAFPSTMQR